MTNKRILVMAGGTGGHVFPALAVATYLSQHQWDVLWLGTAQRMESRLVPQYGFDIEFIDIQGVRGNGLLRKLAAPFKVLNSVMQAKRIIKAYKPDVVLGMGGFASGPGGIAARLSGVPLVVHEQNAIPGMTNKLLARFASRVLCAFENTFNDVSATAVGNPIRQNLIELGQAPRVGSTGALKVLVVGGSLGAKVFNDLMPSVVADVCQHSSITVWHQVGKGNADAVSQAYKKLEQLESAKVTEFIDDMDAAYQWADVVVCRSGALTVSELAAVGLPSILVPYPHAVDDHQTRNAQILMDAKAAFLLPQSTLNKAKLTEKLVELSRDRDQLLHMGQQALTVAKADATHDVAQICIELAK